MPRQPSAQSAAEAWEAGYANCGKKLDAGINRVTESPTVAAARQLPYYMQRVQEAYNSGRTERALMASPLSDWKGGMSGKTRTNLASNATRGKPRYSQFAQSFMPAMAQASATAAGIDKSTREGKLARVAAAIDAAEQWKASH